MRYPFGSGTAYELAQSAQSAGIMVKPQMEEYPFEALPRGCQTTLLKAKWPNLNIFEKKGYYDMCQVPAGQAAPMPVNTQDVSAKTIATSPVVETSMMPESTYVSPPLQIAMAEAAAQPAPAAKTSIIPLALIGAAIAFLNR